MAGCVDADVRTDEAIVAYGDAGFVENREVEVGKEPLTDAYL